MKRLLSILLLLCISAPFWLNYSIYYVGTAAVKLKVMENMFAGEYEDEKTLFKFSHAEAERVLSWEDDYEFRFQGQYYDVFEIEQLPDSVHIVCYWDKGESLLSEVFEEVFSSAWSQEQNGNPANEHIVKLIKTPYKVDTFEWFAVCRSSIAIYPGEVVDQYVSKFLGTPSPPPKVS